MGQDVVVFDALFLPPLLLKFFNTGIVCDVTEDCTLFIGDDDEDLLCLIINNVYLGVAVPANDVDLVYLTVTVLANDVDLVFLGVAVLANEADLVYLGVTVPVNE